MAQSNKPPIKKVLAIGASPRRGGNTDIVIREILAGLQSQAITAQTIHLRDLDFQGCIGCEKCRKDKICTKLIDGMSMLYPNILQAQGLVLVSPVHNYNITSWMKAFLDRLYCFYEFDNTTRPRNWSSRLADQNRKVIISAVCEQQGLEDMGFAMEAMQKPMQALGFENVGILPIFNAFEKGAVKKQEKVMQRAFELGNTLAHHLG